MCVPTWHRFFSALAVHMTFPAPFRRAPLGDSAQMRTSSRTNGTFRNALAEPPSLFRKPSQAAKLETGTYQTHPARHSKTRGLHQLSHPWRTSHRKLWNVGRGRTARVETSLAVFLRHGRRDALSELLTRAPRRRRKTKRFCFLVLRQARHTCFRTRIHASYIRGNTPSLGRVLICK